MSDDTPDTNGSRVDIFYDAPGAWVITDPGGMILRANTAFERSSGFREGELAGRRRLKELMAPGGRIYYETHVDPLLRMQGSVSQIALEFVRADGTRLPALVNAVMRLDGHGVPRTLSVMIFDATSRRRYEQELAAAEQNEREVAQELQRAMVGGELPVADSLNIDVTYLPGELGLRVGGDWYDAFWLDDAQRRIALVVGDVVGHGLGAATTMGQLRNAIRALASTGLHPAALLEALDRYVHRYGLGLSSTVIYAHVDLDSAAMQFACAGHPPPVIISAEARTEPVFDWGGRSTPLGVGRRDGLARSEGVHQLDPGSTVLLYTDGLYERRSRPQEDGLARLLDTVSTLRSQVSGAPIGSAAVRALRDLGDAEDDVCALAFELCR